MGRNPYCSKQEMKRGAWTQQEDLILTDFIKANGEGRWRNLPKQAGLRRCGKSCRLRWLNYLRPDIKRGNISSDEEDIIIRLHKLLGNRWSLIAGRLPGRTDNEIKNYWNTNLGKKVHQNNTTTTTFTSFVSAAMASSSTKIMRMMTNSYDNDNETAKEVIETPCHTLNNNLSPAVGEDLVMDFNAGELSDLLYSDHPLLLLDDYWTSLN